MSTQGGTMNEPKIWVLQDGTYPTFVVVRDDDDAPAAGEPPLAHLLTWKHTLGEAQEWVRDWNIVNERAQEARRDHARDAVADAASW